MADIKKPASLKEIKEFFGMTMPEFKEEWAPLNDAEREYFKLAVGEVLHTD